MLSSLFLCRSRRLGPPRPKHERGVYRYPSGLRYYVRVRHPNDWRQLVRLPGSFGSEWEARRARDRFLAELRGDYPDTLTRFVKQHGRHFRALAEINGELVEVARCNSRAMAEEIAARWRLGERRLFW